MNLAQHSTDLPTLHNRLRSVKHKVLVLSGKGGVGKSTVSCQMAFAMAQRGLRVGILDVDICGPSVPKILGIDRKEVFQSSEGWVPVAVDGYTTSSASGQQQQQQGRNEPLLRCMSIAFLLDSPDSAVVWRGPKKHAMIKQFLEDVHWGELDVLIIDTPPGTSDEHISLCEILNADEFGVDGAVVVTTPQGVAMADVRKELNFCKKLHIPVLGIVENMSGYACPCCREVTYIFSRGGGQQLAQQFEVPFLGAVPIDPRLGESEDQGKDFVKLYPDSVAADKLKDIVTQLWNGMEQKSTGAGRQEEQEHLTSA